jgi:hypothetical protein
MMLLQWQDAYSVGIRIHRGHRELIDLKADAHGG